MVQTFITQIKDKYKNRITIKKDSFEKEDLQPGDYVKVTIEKVKV